MRSATPTPPRTRSTAGAARWRWSRPCLLADAFAAHPDDPAAGPPPTRPASAREVEPWYESAVQMDQLGADPTGRGRGGDGGPAGRAMAAVFVAAATDPVIGRAIARFMNLLRDARPATADVELMVRIAEVMADPEAYPRARPGGPPREALLGRPRHPEGALPMPDLRPPARVSTNGVELHLSRPADEAPVVLWPTASPSWRTRGATRSRPSPTAGYRVLAPDQRGYGRSTGPTPSRTTTSTTSPATWWACSTTWAGAGGVRRPRLGLDGRAGNGAAPPRAHGRLVDMSVPFLPAGACRRCRRCASVRRHVLLHPLLPGAGRRRRRARS